jgi:outer membrane murein-binding lipoprotein Lpp
VLEEQMHGKVYNCGDVIGTLVDGQGTMQSCINRILELAGVQAETAPAGDGGEAAPAASDNHSQSVEVPGMTEDFTGDEPGEGVQMPVQEASEALEPVQTSEVPVAVQTAAEEPIQTTTETIQEINNPEDETTNEPVVPNSSAEVTASQNEEKKMKEYPLIMSALGLNALAVDKEGGYYMNAALCDVLESFVAQANQDKLTMDAKIQEVAQLNAKIEELKGEHEQAINGLTEAHNQEIEKLNGEHAEAINALTEQKDGEIAELNNKVNEANSTIEGLNAQVEAKEAEIKEISEVVTEPQVPAAPTADGVQVVEAPAFENKSVIDDSMSNEQKKEALRKRKEELAKLIG